MMNDPDESRSHQNPWNDGCAWAWLEVGLAVLNNELSKVTLHFGPPPPPGKVPEAVAFKLLFVFHTSTFHVGFFLTSHTCGRSRHFIISGFTSCLEEFYSIFSACYFYRFSTEANVCFFFSCWFDISKRIFFHFATLISLRGLV